MLEKSGTVRSKDTALQPHSRGQELLLPGPGATGSHHQQNTETLHSHLAASPSEQELCCRQLWKQDSGLCLASASRTPRQPRHGAHTQNCRVQEAGQRDGRLFSLGSCDGGWKLEKSSHIIRPSREVLNTVPAQV